MNPDTIRCVWTGEFDLNTLRVDGEIFESGKKKLWIQKYPDNCGRGLKRMGISVWRVILVHVYRKNKCSHLAQLGDSLGFFSEEALKKKP